VPLLCPGYLVTSNPAQQNPHVREQHRRSKTLFLVIER
jgi:hypothetical protein